MAGDGGGDEGAGNDGACKKEEEEADGRWEN